MTTLLRTILVINIIFGIGWWNGVPAAQVPAATLSVIGGVFAWMWENWLVLSLAIAIAPGLLGLLTDGKGQSASGWLLLLLGGLSCVLLACWFVFAVIYGMVRLVGALT